jgi:hypothetical protein
MKTRPMLALLPPRLSPLILSQPSQKIEAGWIQVPLYAKQGSFKKRPRKLLSNKI